jgi:hypothetical protein
VIVDADDLDDLYGSVIDTLQVKAYVNGTTLGPDSHAGLPTLLEFGNFNDNPDNATTSTDMKKFAGNISLGNIAIPMPQSTWWNAGATTPVASYIAKFESPTGLSGSMGLVTADMSSGISRQVRPVTDVKVTGVSTYNATTDLLGGKASSINAAGIPVSNYLDGSELKSPKNIDDDPAPIIAKAFTDKDTENSKVWLSWTNPAGDNISGNIIEFFVVGTPVSSSSFNDDSLPAYAVYVAPKFDKFPIPNVWLKVLGATDKVAIVRIRTVKYGAGGTWIDFNERPFMKALPAAWAETITAPIDFTDTD